MNGQFWHRNGSTILTCLGGAGVITTTVLAVKATPKAMYLIEAAKKEKENDLSKREIIAVAWKPYIPTIIVGSATLACIFGANVLNKRHQASLASAYALLDSSYKEYKQKVSELYGEEVDSEVQYAIAKDHYEEEQVEDDGKELFFEAYSNRYFRATTETVIKAEYEVNRLLVDDCYVSLNEYFELLGLPTTDYGQYVGWSAAQMFDMYWSAWINFRHEKVEMEDGMECYIINVTEPMADFGDY